MTGLRGVLDVSPQQRSECEMTEHESDLVAGPPEFAEHIQRIRTPPVRDAYRLLIGAALCSRRYGCRARTDKRVWDVHFYDGRRAPFSLIVNRDTLLFYVRKPAQNKDAFKRPALKSALLAFEENPNGEFTVRIGGVEDAQAVARHVFGP